MKTVVIVNTQGMAIHSVQSVSKINDIVMPEGEQFIAVYGANSLGDQLSMKQLADLYNAHIHDGATVKKFQTKPKGMQRTWELLKELAAAREAKGVKPVSKVQTAANGRKGIKNCLRETFDTDDVVLTKDDLHEHVATCMGRGCKWVDIAAHISELKNTKYCGANGVLVIERDSDGSFRKNM